MWIVLKTVSQLLHNNAEIGNKTKVSLSQPRPRSNHINCTPAETLASHLAPATRIS